MDDKDLRFVIECKSNQCHDWMAFASWYSIRKRIPDAQVSVHVSLDRPFFRWANKVGVRLSRVRPEGTSIAPTVVAARDFESSLEVSPAKTDRQTCFVDYADGCGNFVTDEWINKDEIPFERALRRFGTQNMTVNEMAVLALWESCHLVYQSVGGL